MTIANMQQCDRAAPQCGQCAEVNVSCEYRSRNAAAIFMLYAQDLEAEIAQLERELDAEADDHVPTPPTCQSYLLPHELGYSELMTSISLRRNDNIRRRRHRYRRCYRI